MAAPGLADSRFALTFDRVGDHDSNQSIIEGWPPGKSRNVARYVRPTEDTVVSDTSCLDLRKVRKDLYEPKQDTFFEVGIF